jgi:hypothetical protein
MPNATPCHEDDADRVIVERRPRHGPQQLSLLKDIYVERGDVNDWHPLEELHYKADKMPFGARFYRCVLHGEVIGVGIMASPKMMLGGRNKVFEHLMPNRTGGKDNRLINRHRAIWLNQNALSNSRLVLDTMYRGAGIAYRMQNLMMRLTGIRFVEFQSSMSKFNPFAAKAGIKFAAPRRATAYEKGVIFFRRWFESPPADAVSLLKELAAMDPASQAKCEAEMRVFYMRWSSLEKTGTNGFDAAERIAKMPVPTLLKSIQQLVLASPLYGVYINPDHGRTLPPRLPLLAFDAQATDQPLDLSTPLFAAPTP